MSDPNDETIKTYQDNFAKFAAKTTPAPSEEFKIWLDTIISLLPKNPIVFEIGSATGRDARYFREHGAQVTCTDVLPEPLALLEKDGFKTSYYDFRDEPKPEWLGAFDGFIANAVLLHAPPEVFKKVLHTIGTIVKPNGLVAFSLKTGDGDIITLEKMNGPRYFKYYTEKGLREILSHYPYEIVSIGHADNDRWLQVILKNTLV